MLIHSSVDGYLGCFHFLAIRNSAAINICVQVLCSRMFSFFLVVYLAVELLGHMVNLRLTFEELPDCFPKWLHYFTFPLAVYESSIFSIFLPILVIVHTFYYSYPSGCKRSS